MRKSGERSSISGVGERLSFWKSREVRVVNPFLDDRFESEMPSPLRNLK